MELVGGSILTILMSCGLLLLFGMVVAWLIFRSVGRKLGSAAHVARQLMSEARRYDEDGDEPGAPRHEPGGGGRRDALLDSIKAVNRTRCPYCETKYDRTATNCPNCGAAPG